MGADVHPTRLGAWAHESDFDSAVFNRAKQYCESKDGINDTHIAGLPVSGSAATWTVTDKNLIAFAEHAVRLCFCSPYAFLR